MVKDTPQHEMSEEQGLHAQRMVAAGQIAAQVADDFNHLLGPMVAYPELIKMQLPAGHPALRYCDTMIEAAERMADMSANLMALACRGDHDLQPVDMNRLVQHALEQTPKRPETLVIETEVDSDLLPVRGSASQLQRMIVNLIVDAREAMRDVGLLTLRTQNVYLDQAVQHGPLVDVGEYVRFQISDTGRARSLETRSRLLDPVQASRTRSKGRGSWLSLSIAQVIVEDHQGHLELQSNAGKGSTFLIYLPSCRDAAEQEVGERLPRPSATVLVVDDDPGQRAIVRMLLDGMGCRVEQVASGEEALVRLARQPADLLLLDMVMPGGMDGVETYRQALEMRPGQRAILTSGFTDAEVVWRLQQLGAGPYVKKPFRLERLARAVRAELDRVR